MLSIWLSTWLRTLEVYPDVVQFTVAVDMTKRQVTIDQFAVSHSVIYRATDAGRTAGMVVNFALGAPVGLGYVVSGSDNALLQKLASNISDITNNDVDAATDPLVLAERLMELGAVYEDVPRETTMIDADNRLRTESLH